ncbi:MAG: hypothetical protein R3335_06655 [Anaerolineales bacterium]|nr:hypothetical protein [Anaerolineales bacterium]
MESGIYLIVQFNFPTPFFPEVGQKAKRLHAACQSSDWIENILTASGGIGPGPSSIWIFKLNSYASLDLLFDRENDASKAYIDFFTSVEDVAEIIRDEVVFT